MTREMWRERWLDSINELTSFDLQVKSWLDKANTNPHWSFVEFICTYFDDLFLDDNYQYVLHNRWITEHELEIIKEWHEELNRYNPPGNDDYDNEAILNDKKWLAIIAMGESAKNKLKQVLTVEEIKILTAEKNVA